MTGEPRSAMHRRLVGALHIDAMLLADEARFYLDEIGRDDRETLDPYLRVRFACESLKATTRLMHVVAWLLTQRAVEAGELAPADARRAPHRLGAAPAFDDVVVAALPARTRALVAASAALYRRAATLDAALAAEAPPASPARAMLQRLESTS